MSRIHLIISGASSVGKTTLVEECLKKFGEDKKFENIQFKRVQEVARKVLQRLNQTGRDLENYIKQNNIEAFCEIQKKIIDEQILAFDKEKNENYFSDRSGFDALAYVHHYFPNQQQNIDSIFESKQFQSLIEQCRTASIFLIEPHKDLQAINDNMRIVPNYQDQIGYTQSLKYYYDKAHLPYFIITDLDMKKRIDFIEKHIEANYLFDKY